MIHYMLLLGYILVTYHKNNIVTLHKTCLLGSNLYASHKQKKTLYC